MAGESPRLLSGGNPQIPKGDGDAPVREYIAGMPGWKADVGRERDAIIERAVPGATRAVRWNAPFYGVPGGGWFATFRCFTRYVKVTFFDGVDLDPVPPEAGKDDRARHLHVHEGEDLDAALLTRWMQQASRLPGYGSASPGPRP